MCYVLYIMNHVLRVTRLMYHVSCIMHHVSCSMYYISCIMCNVLYIMNHVSCVMCYVLCITISWNLHHITNNKTYLYNTNNKTNKQQNLSLQHKQQDKQSARHMNIKIKKMIPRQAHTKQTNSKPQQDTHEHQDKEYDTKTNTHKAKELSLGQSRFHLSQDQQVSTKSTTYIQVEPKYIYMKTTYNNTSKLINHYNELYFKTYPQ